MAQRKTYWMGHLDDECQICNRPFNGEMYDAAIPSKMGAWGNICKTCFKNNGCKTGTGFGQQYTLQADKRWLKVKG
jgi:hypothetical protein